MYKEFAKLYDNLTKDINYEIWCNYLLSIKSNPKKILDLGCGTGSVAKILLDRGFDLTCLDISEDMLIQASTKLQEYGRVNFIKADMVDFISSDKYDLIFSFCDGINYILDEESLVTFFNNMYKNLEKNGILIFEISSEYKLINILGNNIFINEEDGIYYTWENFLDLDKRIVEFYLNFFVEEKSGLYQRFDEYHIQKIYAVSDIIRLLQQSEFEEFSFYETYSFNEPKNDSERITFIAKK